MDDRTDRDVSRAEPGQVDADGRPVVARPLDLGPITALTNLGKLPYVRITLVWTGFILLLIAIFRLTHHLPWFH